MALKSKIVDPLNGTAARVSERETLVVGVDPAPATLPQNTIPFRRFMTRNGDSDMRVSGSLVSPVQFSVTAPAEGRAHLLFANFVIADAGATLNQFGSIGALTNGCQFGYRTSRRQVLLADTLRSNFDFVRLSRGQPAFGNGATSFRANNVVGTAEGYIPSVDLTVFAPGGIQLPQESPSLLFFNIRDDVTGVDGFTCVVHGYIVLPPDVVA